MATQAELIAAVRRIVADFKEPQRYDKEYYVEALQFALDKLNFDFGEEYASVDVVPASRTFLLKKLAAIQMCYVRAAAGAEGVDGEGDETRYTSVAVPDLSVTDNSAQDSRGPAFWMKLARELQDEYDGEKGDISAGQNQGGEVEQGISRRISLTNGGYRKRKLDEGPPATTASTVVDASDVLVTWSKVFIEDFLRYEVYRATSATMKDEIIIRREVDNHETEWVDEDLTAGTYYYRVAVRNRNDLRTNSTTVSAVVA